MYQKYKVTLLVIKNKFCYDQTMIFNIYPSIKDILMKVARRNNLYATILIREILQYHRIPKLYNNHDAISLNFSFLPKQTYDISPLLSNINGYIYVERKK